jgi:Tfp pilus assembly protein FimT
MDILGGLALSGLVISIAMPGASSLLERYQVRGATSQISFELVRARMQAISQNRSVRIRFPGNGRYIVERTNAEGSFSKVISSSSLPSGIDVSAEFSSVIFDREGVANQNVVITIGKGEAHRTISMNSIGRMTES